MFPNNTAARISAEISKAWNNEPDHVKREYEIQALRERQVLELKTFPDYQYTKSTGSGTGAFNSATTGVASGPDAGALSLALGSLSMKDGSRSGG
ncbi:hypothetical protein BGX24_007801 [Mortierella sp. AD032]|nr:hypothetical protein BGX24_007801 [Mortierella sp. AD032]